LDRRIRRRESAEHRIADAPVHVHERARAPSFGRAKCVNSPVNIGLPKNSERQMKLTIREVPYLSENDERRFFEGLKSIPAVVATSGEFHTLDIDLDLQQLDDTALRELLALFMRYAVEMSCLRVLLTDENREWFHDNATAYWHQQVFGEE
jgi:hypothetical protein